MDLGRRSSGNSIVHTRQIVMHDSVAYLKCCESLSFLVRATGGRRQADLLPQVRDVVHVTPDNFPLAIAAIRTFVEASYRGEQKLGDEGRKLKLLARWSVCEGGD